MLIIFSDGRFGNQLFQLSGAMSARVAGEKVLLVGFSDLPRNWTEKGVFIFRKNHSRTALGRYLSNRFQRFFRQLSRWRLVSGLRVDTRNRSFLRKRGVLGGIVIGMDRWMQVGDLASPTWATSIYEALVEINPNYIERRETIFIHVRRTDYLTFPSTEHPAALPASFFSIALSLLRQKFPGAALLIFSDDPAWCASQDFSKSGEILDVSPYEAWARMCASQGGVLSPSSFSYWAAIVAAHRAKQGTLFLAPRYWWGWNEERWQPKLISSRYIRYLPVLDEVEGTSS